MRWPAIARILLFLLSVGAFLAGGNVAANYLIETQRERQLEEFGNIALRRSETAVFYGISTLRDFAQRGNIGCDGGALQSVRLFVYRSGAMKDIRIVRPDASVVCAAFSETLEFDKGWATRAEMLPSVGGASRLFRVEQFFGTALGAMIDVNSEYSLVGIMSVDGSLIDVMPSELRNQSVVALELDNGQTIARTASGAVVGDDTTIRLSTESERYPLRTVVRVDKAALAAWNRQPYMPIVLASGILGAFFGLLLARSLFRPMSPLEELDRAIALGHVRPYFQPIFDLRTGEITGAEVLARWIKPDGTVISPARFIELAEDSGRIADLTWQLLSTALAELRPLLTADKNFCLSVNISPPHFVSDGFIQKLRETTAAANVATRQITLELTERQSFEDPGLAAAVVAEARGYGYKVAIDDVGIGHSGLSQIQRLRADVLKIDKFFVDSVNLDASATAMIAMLVRLAREMGMRVIAEGIEEQAQVDALINCGIAYGQGYVVAPPLPQRAFLDLVASRAGGQPAQAATRAA
ncbi:MAG: EAL domain-containing protein [Rhizobiaceae bacterium]|nr:EAL domain-containing protein [Rhizobiaceae bacterium]